MRKLGFVLAIITCGSLSVSAQKGDYVIDEQSKFTDRIYFGGGMGLSGGTNGTSINISPIVGYMVSI